MLKQCYSKAVSPNWPQPLSLPFLLPTRYTHTVFFIPIPTVFFSSSSSSTWCSVSPSSCLQEGLKEDKSATPTTTPSQDAPKPVVLPHYKLSMRHATPRFRPSSAGTPSRSDRSKLFAGLEETQGSDFTPRQSVKKLILTPKSSKSLLIKVCMMKHVKKRCRMCLKHLRSVASNHNMWSMFQLINSEQFN